MTITRSRVLAGVMCLSAVGITAAAQSPKMKNLVLMEVPLRDNVMRCGFGMNQTSYELGVGYVNHCPMCRDEQQPSKTADVPVKVDLAAIIPVIEVPKFAEAAPLLPNLELRKITPTIEPPLAPPVQVVELPKIASEPMLPIVTPAPVAVPVPAPRVVQVEAVAPAKFNRILIDYSAKMLKFEVHSGTMILKVECDAIEVRMPGEQGTTATPLKATGHVMFSAPGCTGSCDELVIYTATGEAVLHGNVKLRCRQGSVETEVTGTSVKFKLGAATTTTPEVERAPDLIPGSR
ncbi:hypothetical protein BH11PLA2_BH11PLA2_48080 [soil metagenome]